MSKTKKSFALVSLLMTVLLFSAIFAFMPQLHAEEPYVDFKIPFLKYYGYQTFGLNDELVDTYDDVFFKYEPYLENTSDPAQAPITPFPSENTVRLCYNPADSKGPIKTEFMPIRFTIVGRYYYRVFEEPGHIPGCVYDDTVYIVCIEVKYNDDNELTASIAAIWKDRIVNSAEEKQRDIRFYNTYYLPSSLTLSKTVTGELGDHNRDFKFHVFFFNNSYNFDAGEHGKITAGEGIITLKHGESVTFTGLPAFSSYRVWEEDCDPYEISVVNNWKYINYNFAEGEIQPDYTVKVAFTNNLPYTPVVGLNMDVLPFILIGIVSLGGVAFLKYKKLRRTDVR